MLKRCNSLNDQIIKKMDNVLSILYKSKNNNINKHEHSAMKLPKISQNIEYNSLNNNIETTNSSHKIIKSKSNHIFIPISEKYKNSFNIQSEETNKKIFPLKIKRNKLLPLNYKLYSSEETIIPKKIQSISTFHKRLMEQNYLSCKKKLKEDYIKMKNNETEKEEVKQILFGKRLSNKINTGIFGPSNNIVSVIRKGIERLRLENEYKGVNEEIKELIKDEIIDAQVKLKRKPISLTIKKREITPLYKKKMDKYRYLKKMNLVREINQNSTTPIIVDDGHMMIKLINKAFDNYKSGFNE